MDEHVSDCFGNDGDEVVAVVYGGLDDNVGPAEPSVLLDFAYTPDVPGGLGTSGTAAGPSLTKPRFEKSSGAMRLLFIIGEVRARLN